MPVTFCIDSAGRIIRSRASGIVSYDEIVHHLKAKQQRHVLDYAELFDARDAQFDLSVPDLHRIANEVRRVMADTTSSPIAVVTNSNFIRGLARAYASLTIRNNPAFEIFDNVKDARDWIARLSPIPASAPVATPPSPVRNN